jgi:hypothetical protein
MASVLSAAAGPKPRPSQERTVMNVTIRKLEHKDHEYLAYAKSLCGRGTYFVYFQDNIWGAVVLHNFIEMLRAVLQPPKVQLGISDKTLSFQDPALLDLFTPHAS